MQSALLKLSTLYGMHAVAVKALKLLLVSWPVTLAQWESREKDTATIDGVYTPRPGLPHPL